MLTIVFTCSKDNPNTIDIKNENFDLIEKVTLNKSTSDITELFLNMGVTGIEVTKNLETTIYEFETAKTFILNGNSIDLSNYLVTFENGLISLNSNPSLKLTLLDGQPYIIKPNYSGFINNSQDEFKVMEFNILLLFMKEMTTDKEQKINTVSLLNSDLSRAGCSFWDTYYVYSTGGSRSVAIANLEAQVAFEESPGEDVEGCRKIGSPDSSCVWENHGCVATQAYCCD